MIIGVNISQVLTASVITRHVSEKTECDMKLLL